MESIAPLLLIWHHHQPLYRDLTRKEPRGSYRQPWVRLHALRDYYGMAALVAQHPGVKVTFNFSAGLLWQIEDYALRGATDEAFELATIEAGVLDAVQRARLIETSFAADLHHQILPHARYHELYQARQAGRPFTVQELRDLQVWATLAWFGKEFREAPVTLVTGEVVDVAGLVAQERDFQPADVCTLAEAQRRVLRAIIPLHRKLQDDGRIEIALSAYFHPILPLLIDTDAAAVEGGPLRPPFRHPEDAEAQVVRALAAGMDWFGGRAQGMWPPEGAVCRALIPLLGRAGVRWLATDQGVLARSGRWGYEASDVRVRARVYAVEEAGHSVAAFFRDTELSDDIAFRCHLQPDVAAAARAWLDKVRGRVERLGPGEGRAITVVLDGENAWGSYPADGRTFLHALYSGLAGLHTATPAEVLRGRPAATVATLFPGSWIDEAGSPPGVDLGTWIGEPEEDRAWTLLREARDALARSGLTEEQAPLAYQALYAAEGSDWFWWYGRDQDSGHDGDFDELFRGHLRAVYLAIGAVPPRALALSILKQRSTGLPPAWPDGP